MGGMYFYNRRACLTCLNLVTAAIVQWNTVYLEWARPALRQTGKLQFLYESASKSMP